MEDQETMEDQEIMWALSLFSILFGSGFFFRKSGKIMKLNLFHQWPLDLKHIQR